MRIADRAVAIEALWRDESAPTAVEYAIMAGGIAVAIVATVGTLGEAVLKLFEDLSTKWP